MVGSPVGSWHWHPRCIMVFVWDAWYLAVAPHFHGSYSSLQFCCEGPWFTNIQEDRCDLERINRILQLREMFQLLLTGFYLVNAAVVCAIIESISGLEPLSDTTEPRYLKLVTVSTTSIRLLLSPCWGRWCCLPSVWSSRDWSPCRCLWLPGLKAPTY